MKRMGHHFAAISRGERMLKSCVFCNLRYDPEKTKRPMSRCPYRADEEKKSE